MNKSAVIAFRREIIELLPEAENSQNTTLPHAAAHKGNKNVVELLLMNGADVEAKDINGNTALNWAVPYGNIDIVELLMAHGANVNAKNNFGVSPLDSAASFGNEYIAEALLAAGAKKGDVIALSVQKFFG